MGDHHRRTGTKSRVSKETKLRLRVIFLDDSERTFEVEVRAGTGVTSVLISDQLSGVC